MEIDPVLPAPTAIWAVRGRKQAISRAQRPASEPPYAIPARVVHYKLANLLGAKMPEEDLTALRDLVQRDCDSDEHGIPTDWDRSLLDFGLARVLDARGAYDEAAAHAVRANALRRTESAGAARTTNRPGTRPSWPI